MNENVELENASIETGNFVKNLYALAGLKPDFARCIAEMHVHPKLRLTANAQGFISGEYAVNSQFRPFFSAEPWSEVACYCQKHLVSKRSLLLLGSGLGHSAKYLLEHSSVPLVYLYERDLYLLKVALTLHDFAGDLAAGRLVILEQSGLNVLCGLEHAEIVTEPLLFSRNQVEFLTLSRILRDRKMSEKRALFLAGAQLYTLDCAATLHENGWDVYEIDPACLTAEMTNRLLDRLDPHLVFKINHLKNIEQYARNRVVVEWEVDPTLSPVAPVVDGTANVHVFTHNPERLLKLRQSDYRRVEYLPLCANLTRLSATRRGPGKGEFVCDVSFVGSLMLNNQQILISALAREVSRRAETEGEGWVKLRKWLENMQRCCVSAFEAGSVAELDVLLQQNDLPEAVVLDGREVLIKLPVQERQSYFWRKQVIDAILPFQPKIWGNAEWQRVYPRQYQGFADHYLDLPQIYRCTKINLDIARLYQPNIVTMRVFDVLACGAFVLAARCEALHELFEEDVEIVCYSTPEEAADKVDYYLKNAGAREAIARRGHARVAKSHTFGHRIQTIFDVIGMNPTAEHSPQSLEQSSQLSEIL